MQADHCVVAYSMIIESEISPPYNMIVYERFWEDFQWNIADLTIN